MTKVAVAGSHWRKEVEHFEVTANAHHSNVLANSHSNADSTDTRTGVLEDVAKSAPDLAPFVAEYYGQTLDIYSAVSLSIDLSSNHERDRR